MWPFVTMAEQEQNPIPANEQIQPLIEAEDVDGTGDPRDVLHLFHVITPR